MTTLAVSLHRFFCRVGGRSEGQTMAEYALILGGIAVVVIAAIVFLGDNIRDLFESTGSSVSNPTG